MGRAMGAALEAGMSHQARSRRAATLGAVVLATVIAVLFQPWTMRFPEAAAQAQEPSPTSRPEIESAPYVEPGFAESIGKAQNGDLEAQCNVGARYINGQGVPRDYGAGIAWLYASANGGFSHAQYVLGLLYGQGFGNTPADPFRSWFWSALAVAKGDLPPSEMHLAEKLRDAAQKQLSLADLNRVQAMAREWWAGRMAGPR